MNQENTRRPALCYVAGKSAGHILPCLTRAREVVKRYPAFSILFFTSDGSLDKKVIDTSSVVTTHVPLKIMNVPRAKWYLLPVFIMQLIASFFKALFYLRKCKPRQVVTTGGYIAIPVVLAAWMLRIPVELQSLDAVPGKALRFLTPFAQVITIVFKSNTQFFPPEKCLTANYPIRFGKQEASMSKDYALSKLGLRSNRFTLFVLGGSQGSQFLNDTLKMLLTSGITTDMIQIIHQTGNDDTQAYTTLYNEMSVPAYVFSYYDQLALCYKAADLIMCRAGAGTLFEIMFFKTPCILIPLESNSTTHQKDNACAIAAEHPDLCTIVEQKKVENDSQILTTLVSKAMIQWQRNTVQRSNSSELRYQ